MRYLDIVSLGDEVFRYSLRLGDEVSIRCHRGERRGELVGVCGMR